MRQLRLAYILPILALATVGFVMTGLGGLFSAVGNNGTIIFGLTLVVLIPAVSYKITTDSKSAASKALMGISIGILIIGLVFGELYWLLDALDVIAKDAWHIGS